MIEDRDRLKRWLEVDSMYHLFKVVCRNRFSNLAPVSPPSARRERAKRELNWNRTFRHTQCIDWAVTALYTLNNILRCVHLLPIHGILRLLSVSLQSLVVRIYKPPRGHWGGIVSKRVLQNLFALFGSLWLEAVPDN